MLRRRLCRWRVDIVMQRVTHRPTLQGMVTQLSRPLLPPMGTTLWLQPKLSVKAVPVTLCIIHLSCKPCMQPMVR